MSYIKENKTMFMTDAYEFKPCGRFSFFQTWLWKLLHKMNCLCLKSYWDTEVKVERVIINRQDFGTQLYEAYRKCFPPRKKPTHIYMGPMNLI